MTRLQYRALCRVFIAERFNVCYSHLHTLKIANPVRHGRAPYRHLVDLHWVTENAVCRYVHIAHTRWRDAAPLDLAAVLRLQQVRQKLAAHKALLITNTCFSARAVAAALDDGIALFLVRPAFDHHQLTARGPYDAVAQMQRLVSRKAPLYTYQSVH